MLMMIVGVGCAFSSQCVQNVGDFVYFKTKDQKVVRFDVKDSNSAKVLVQSDVRDFKVEANDEITVMSMKGILKRVKIDAPEQVIKSIQLQNGNSTSTHWTTFCRLGKHTCVAGHDSKSKQLILVNVFDLNTQQPIVVKIDTAYNCKFNGSKQAPFQSMKHFKTFKQTEIIVVNEIRPFFVRVAAVHSDGVTLLATKDTELSDIMLTK